MANYRYMVLGDTGKPTSVQAVSVYGSASDAGRVVALGPSGRISSSLVVVDYYSITGWPAMSAVVVKGDGSFGLVGTENIASAAVTSGKIASAAATGRVIADSAVGESKIADAAVTNAKLATNAVTATKIADDSIMPSHLAQMPSFYHQVSDEIYNCWRRDSGVPLHCGFYGFADPAVPTFIGNPDDGVTPCRMMLGFTYSSSNLPGPGSIDFSTFRFIAPTISDARVEYGVILGGYKSRLLRDRSTAINSRDVSLNRRGDLALNCTNISSSVGSATDTAYDTRNNAYVCAHNVTGSFVIGSLFFGRDHVAGNSIASLYFFDGAQMMSATDGTTNFSISVYSRHYGYKDVVNSLQAKNSQVVLAGSLNQGGTVYLTIPFQSDAELVIPSGKCWAVRHTVLIKGRTNAAVCGAIGGRFVARAGASGSNVSDSFVQAAGVALSVSLVDGNVVRFRCAGGVSTETVFDIIAQLDILEI